LPSALFEMFHQRNQGLSYAYATLFFLTGTPERLSAAALNCFCGALTVVLTYRTARLLFSSSVAARAGWWTCWLPSMVIWSAQTVKEPIVILLEAIALYACVCLQQRGLSLRHLALCAVTIVLLLPFRFYAAYIVGMAVLFSLLVPAPFPGRGTLAYVALLPPLLSLLVAAGVTVHREARFEQFSLKRAQIFREGVSRPDQGSGVKTEDIRTPGGFVVGTAIGAAHLLLAPFPWQLRDASLRMQLVLPELLFWWWLLFTGVIPGLRYVVRHRLMDVRALLLFVLGFGLLYSIMFGNIGLAFRQRAQLLPWLLIVGAVGLEQRTLRRGHRKASAQSPPVVGSFGGARRVPSPDMPAESRV
jgi:hypothetical protein